MKCDVCGKEFVKTAPILRWRSYWPDNKITHVVALHKACDTHKWPADGYGHIDARALSENFVDDLCERAHGQGEATLLKLRLALHHYGQTPPEVDPFFDWPIIDEWSDEYPF